jgi:outer membrane protein insertion porin family
MTFFEQSSAPLLSPHKINTQKTTRMILFFSSSALVLSLLSGMVHADVVQRIHITGNKRIENATILSYISIKPGVDYSSEDLDAALKALYNTGYFADVKIRREGSDLNIDVSENAIINKIAFEGNSKLKDDKLKEEIQLHPREVLSRTKIQAAQQRILDIYQRMGRYNATVEPKIIKQNDNRVDLVFEINEGDVTYVRKINFVGNKHVSSSHLAKALLTKETRWYNFFATTDTYDPDRFVGDQHFLRQYYLDSGYPDFRLISAVAELSSDQKDMFLTFTIDEGERYKFGKIDIISKIPNLKPEFLHSAVIFSSGDWFSNKMIEKTINALTDRMGENGFAFTTIEPVIEKNFSAKTVDIRFEIKEGPRVYVERIEFRGNERTRDEVLRREMRIHEGDAFNATYLKEAEQELNDLGYFKKVEVDTEQGSAPDKAKIVVKVEEQSTGEFGFAIGFSTLDKFLGNIRYAERNFMGTGRTLHSDLTLAIKKQEFDVGISDPYFMGYNLLAGVDAFHTRSTRLRAFTEQNTGGNFHVGYSLTNNWYQTLGYEISRDVINDLPKHVSYYIRKQKGTFLKSIVSQSLSYDQRNSRREPTAGYSLTLSNSFAGVGGDIGYLKNALATSVFYSPWEDVILNARFSIGNIVKTSKIIRVADSIMLGGETLRGFAYGGVGPYDKKTDDRLGGTRFWVGTLEAVFPIGLPNEFGVKGAAFLDVGTVWKTANKKRKHPIVDHKSPRLSAGLGLSWDSPFGPLRLDYSIYTKKNKGDNTQRTLIGVSRRF